jgi:hypothetical protein
LHGNENENAPKPVIVEKNPTVNNNHVSGDAHFHPMMPLQVL